MSNLKAEVLQYLQNDRTYAGAKAIYLRHVQQGAFRSRLVSALESELMRDMIRDELVRLAGINEVVADRMWKQRIVQQVEVPAAEEDKSTTSTNQVEETPESIVLEISKLKTKKDLLAAIALLKPDFVNEDFKNRELSFILLRLRLEQFIAKKTAQAPENSTEAADEQGEAQADSPAEGAEKTTLPAGGENSGAGGTTPAMMTGKVLPDDVQKAIRLREEFPFLAAADCPQELRGLVGAMLDAYDQYRHAHAQLFEAKTPEELDALTASVAEGYLENRQIWEELNYYKQNGTVLGKHPSLVKISLRERINRMTVVELAKRKETIIKSIFRRKKQLEHEAEAKPHLVDGWKQALELDEYELDQVNAKLSEKG